MTTPNGTPHDHQLSNLRLLAGADLVADWFAGAAQPQKNAVTRILFAVVENSVFGSFPVIDDATDPMQFFVLASSLAIKIRINDFTSFDVLYIGPSCTAPGLDRASAGTLKEETPEKAADEQPPAPLA